jgi:methylated-DNA-[protein]-cysteine S-methyltransferase
MRFAEVGTPVGRLTLVAGEAGLRAVLWRGEQPPRDAESGGHPVLAAAEQQLHEYFAGTRRVFELPLDLVGTPFQQRAWLALSTIPFATTISYGEQARRLGLPRAFRAVGAANGRNPLSIVLPCHRVVGANGALTGYGGGLEAKQRLLAHERHVADLSDRGGTALHHL